MKIIISPAKKLNFDKEEYLIPSTEIEFATEAEKLIKKLKKLKPKAIAELMSLSPALAQLNYERYQTWDMPFDTKKIKPAAFAFDGEVYSGLDIRNYSAEDLEYAQNHLMILSGLYGVIKPMDTILPYRLEMGTRLEYSKTIKTLYQYWDKTLSKRVTNTLQKEEILVNLASEEYSKVLKLKDFKHQVITPVFKERSAKGYKVVMVYAKQARGIMASYILKNRIKSIEDIKNFKEARYQFNPEMSSKDELVFVR